MNYKINEYSLVIPDLSINNNKSNLYNSNFINNSSIYDSIIYDSIIYDSSNNNIDDNTTKNRDQNDRINDENFENTVNENIDIDYFNNTKKKCSYTGLTYIDTISTHPIFAGSCNYLGKRSNCKPPIKATTTPYGSRGIPLTGNYNIPGFSLTRAYRISHAVQYHKSKPRIAKVNINNYGRHEGAPLGSRHASIRNTLI